MKIEFDYRFDTNGFFDSAERREALEYAGEVWSNLLQDDFEAIPAGAQFTTLNPTTGNAETIVLDNEIDDLLIFVGSGSLDDGNNGSANLHLGHSHLHACTCSHCIHQSEETTANKIVNLARSLADETSAGSLVNLSQPGILNSENSIDVDSLLAQAQINGTDLVGDIFQRRISNDFRDTGVVRDFEPWAGTISFSPSQNINWSFDLENTDNSTVDFISVALHEIGHILGIGTAPIFDSLGAGGNFTGVNALEANNGNPIPLLEDLSHVAEGFSNNTVLLDPLLNANRNLPSDFDLALLADIGYEIEGFSEQGFVPDLATNGSENIIGSDLNDNINGLAGDDSIQGNDGNDTITGSDGADTIFGTAGDDFLSGEAGTDSLHGGVGGDTIDGGTENDLLVGAAGNDFLFGREGNDQLQGNEGNDVLQGGAGHDTLFGQDDADFLSGNQGNDQIQGGGGADSIQGNEGNDTIFGGAGADIIDSGQGDDILLGEGGRDRFFFDLNNGNDTINDFIVAEDTIEIAASFGFNNGNDLLAAITSSGEAANSDNLFSEIALSESNTLTVFHDTDLQASNFEIVSESSIGTFNLNVDQFTQTNSGFQIRFSDRINTEVLDLNDFSLVRASTSETVAGSLVWDAASLTISFVKSGGILESDRYEVQLISNENSFVSETGIILDGDNNDIAGGNFNTEFTIANDPQRILSLDDFALAPGNNTTLDLAIDNGTGVTQAEFTIVYNPELLSIQDLTLDSDLTNDWTITTEDISIPGTAIVSIEGTTALGSGATDLIQLQVSSPNDAIYGIADLVTITDINLNGGNLEAVGDIALHNVALTGDVNGDGIISDADSYLISQMAVGLGNDLEAFPLKDSFSLVDINQDGIISATDSFLVAQQI